MEYRFPDSRLTLVSTSLQGGDGRGSGSGVRGCGRGGGGMLSEEKDLFPARFMGLF